MRRSIVLLLILFGCAGFSTAQFSDPQATLARARTATTNANHAEAIEAYESLSAEGLGSAGLYLNLGNAYLARGDTGRAVLAYERGLRLAPNDRALNRNRQLVRDSQRDAIVPFPEFFLLRWWDGIAGLLSFNTWAWTGLLLFWLAGAAFFLFRLRGMNSWAWLAGGLLLIALLGWAFANSRYQDRYRNDQAVLLSSSTQLRVAPGEDAPLESEVHAGLTLRILDQFGDWTKVELRDGRQGWLHREEVALVRE